MPGGMVFEYRCSQGHLTEKTFPPRTAYDKHSTVICTICLDKGIVNQAYLVFACPESQAS